MAQSGLTISTQSKVAGTRQTIPITPEKTTLQTLQKSPYQFTGQISPGPNAYNHPHAHQWHTANATFAATNIPPVVAVNNTATITTEKGNDIPSIETAVKSLQIVDETGGDDDKKMETTNDAIPDMNKDGLGSRKSSNPHHVSKNYANKLHEVISNWYPKQAGKLTGMFLQNHDQDKVVKY